MGISLKKAKGYGSTVNSKQKLTAEPKLTVEQIYDRIKHLLPTRQRRIGIDNLSVLRALQYIKEHKCSWRKVPKTLGKGRTIHQRFRRWCIDGHIEAIENELRDQGITCFPWSGLPTKFTDGHQW